MPRKQLAIGPARSGGRVAGLRAAFGWRDVVLAVGIVVLLLAPVGARVAADVQPIAPRLGVGLPPNRAGGVGGRVRSLPEFMTLAQGRVAALVAGGRAPEQAAIALLARRLFGPDRMAVFNGWLAGRVPFSRLGVTRFEPSKVASVNDLAAMLMIAGAVPVLTPSSSGTGAVPAGGAAAVVLLRRVAANGDCAPRLNLAFALSADTGGPFVGPVTAAYRAAIAACPHDPTALWAFGEFESLLAPFSVSEHATLQTFAVLQQRFPRSAAGWAGAGDAELRFGYLLQPRPGVPGEPFTAEHMFERAVALYRRADALDPSAGILSGIARGQAALGEEDAAVATQGRALARDPNSAEMQARLLDYLQRAHAFPRAAQVAARLTRVHRFPDGSELFAEPFGDLQPSEDEQTSEDLEDPLSIGAGVAEPVKLPISPPQPFLSPATTNDLSYIPTYVPMSGVGGDARWCPGWSRLVDLLLSGHPQAVLTGYHGRFRDLRPGGDDCQADLLLSLQPGGVIGYGPEALAGVADLELGNIAAARKWASRALTAMSLSTLEDLRQNLWRYAGELTHAAQAAAQWAATLPWDTGAILQEGEIAFLQRRYDRAGVDFAVAADRYGWQHPDTQASTLALLDEGTALDESGRRHEALVTLAQAAQTAVLWSAASGNTTSGAAQQLAAFAQELEGQILLGMGRFQDAVDDYAMAASSDAIVGQNTPLTAGGGSLRPEVLDNNDAIAQIAAGDPSSGAELARRAISLDPGDGIPWWTLAQAEQRDRHPQAAIADYRAALARDPTEFPAANNLGVLLLQQGHSGLAIAALRRSVGADRSYATGWFNLGVALGQQGPLRLLASEGSFARARKLDSALVSRVPKAFLDNLVYQSRLDLSKPLPPRWTFASSQIQAPVAAAGLSAMLLVVVGLARALSSKATSPDAAQRLSLLARFGRRQPRSRALRDPRLAITATVLYLLWPLRSAPIDQWTEQVAYLLGVLILVAVVTRVRQLAALHAHTRVTQETWLPAVGLGLVLTITGLPWTPLPVARVRARAKEVHWAGPTTIAGLALILLLLSAWTNVPLTRSLGASALVMAASMLTPVKPLDGATVTSTPAGALPTLAVLGTAILLLTGLL